MSKTLGFDSWPKEITTSLPGVIRSPNFPQKYPRDDFDYGTITVPKNKIIRLTFTFLQVIIYLNINYFID